MQKLPNALWIFVLLAFGGLSLFLLQDRYRMEQSNRAVGLAMELGVIEDMALASGISPAAALQRLQEAGLTAVVVSEQRLFDWSDQNPQRRMSVTPGAVRIEADERVDRVLRSRFGTLDTDEGALLLPVPLESARLIPVGLDPVRLQWAREQGLEVIARHGNVFSQSDAYLDTIFAMNRELGVTAFLPEGDSVLGTSDDPEVLAEVLARYDIQYAAAEFSNLMGDRAFASRFPGQVVRLHAITPAEALRLSERVQLERFVRAFRERNLRWMLIRPLQAGGEDPISLHATFLEKLSAEIEAQDGAIRSPRPFDTDNLPRQAWLAWVSAAVLFIMGLGLGKNERWRRPYLLSLLVGLLSVAISPLLAVSLLFPTVAIGWWIAQGPRSPFAGFILISAFSLAAGLIIAAAGTSPASVIAMELFRGVRAAHILPVILVAGILAASVADIRALAKQPIVWGSAALVIVLLGAAYLMLARTGNENPGAVSGLELRIRALLDQILYVRPRTKEFLIGHPLMLAGLWLWLNHSHLRPWAAVAIALGTIGQVSIINTLCHFHTPLMINVPRIGIGLVVGSLFGLALIAALKVVLHRWQVKPHE